MLHEDGLVSWQASCFSQSGGRSPNLCIFDGIVKGEQQPKEITLKNNRRSSFPTAIIFAILWIVFAVFLHAQDAQFHNAPASSVHMKNPYAGQQTAAGAGSRLYATNCSSCHGTHGQGNGAMPALVQGPTQSASDGEIFWFITTGAPDKGMPPWSTLPERQRWQLVTYLKSLKNSHGAQESGSASK
jgi:mono/diheme cytochrome c family protein